MRSRIRNWGPGLLMVAPSIVVIAVFVYVLIGATVNESLTDRHTAAPAENYVGLENYANLLDDDRFIHSLKNLAVLTVVFVTGTLVLGVLWAFLLEKGVKGEGFFRSAYLFPMAVSFVASGVVWRWLLNSAEGEGAGGLNALFGMAGLDVLQNPWWSHPDWGMAAMAVPAIWQLSGYVMALFLAGFRGIPNELREAARVDGASEAQLYRHVLFPQLSPVALTALIIIGHMSMKMFDLIMAVSGAQYLTEVPAVYMWQALLTNDYAKAAAIAIVLLVVVAVLVVPYLIHNARTERQR
ncbi:carbohydrate ABC transporter permease [Phytoactinopolyspora halotolerans]|uniref:Sugar ABC transporter permease n=1 Tax=Phytoactinopolyspora halotolerans TaxID=1981512 RepID=A0A6L9S2H3_9ACTN|nr:sugar ABC transporter permease [Phytoactinopolyspora halotolerans]NED99258.1 sugar ABC transporter permease [Phytoactinopolyspora halotolerans]